jgi:hypothetical protein
MQMERAAIVTARAIVDESAFENLAERRFFRAIVQLFDNDTEVDPLTLAAHLETIGDLELVGGKDRIAELLDVVPTAANVSHHAKLVRDAALRRRIREISTAVLADIGSAGITPATVTDSYQRALAEAMQRYGPSNKTRIRLEDDLELMEMEDPPWMVDGILPGKRLIQLFGEPSSMKTFVAVDLACHVAAGLDWQHRRTQRGAVVYICAEGVYGMKRRIGAWKQHHGYKGKLGVFFLRSRIGLAAAHPDIPQLIAEIKCRVANGPRLIVVDTLSRNLEGNENAAEDMNAFIVGCDTLRDVFDCAVLIIHHSGYADGGRARGSSALKGALDTDIQCTRDGERVTLECRKQKDAEEFPKLSFEALPIAGSLVLEPVDQLAGKLDGNRRKCLLALHRIGKSSHAQWRKEAGLPKSSFGTSLNWLLHGAYVQKIDRQKYGLTESGRQACGPWSNASPLMVSSVEVNDGPSRGGLKDPAMDLAQLGA